MTNKLITIAVADMTNPTEINAWLADNPSVTIQNVSQFGSMFYIFFIG